MSENVGHGGFNHNDKPGFMEMYPILNEVELINYHARKISEFCKEHRCATCPSYTPDGICKFLTNSPCDWKGIEKNANND